MNKKIIAFSVVVALVGGGALLLNTKSQKHAHETGPILLPVVVEARMLAVGHTRLTQPAVADVQALRDSVVASRLTAYVTALPLFEGERFKKGAILAKLDVSQAEADLQRSAATLAQSRLQEGTLAAELAAAESSLKAEEERTRRVQTLYKIQGVSLEQVQSAEAALAAVRARHAASSAAMQSYASLLQANNAAVTAARENLRYGLITAPFDGVVSQRMAQPGDLVTPGKPLLKITDTAAGTRLLVSVPETLHPAGLRIGDQMLPLTPWPEAGAQGLRRYEARSQDAALLPGSRIDARLVIFRSPEAVLLPRVCLLNDDGHSATVLALKEEGGEIMPAQESTHQPAHQPEHPGQNHHQPHDQAPAHAMVQPAAAGGHHRQPQSAGQIEAIRVTLTAQGEEGAVGSDAALGGRRVVCASPDILSRLVAGAPFSIQVSGK
ncbi:MAG: HlyD family efflux transporter periplasmic adaptor subunit [Sulfuricella sp.]|nr:HlyD family efflux transporter periplasmic adaptor subunit [Sulfuricella sp.]